jgi:hypothetical protein
MTTGSRKGIYDCSTSNDCALLLRIVATEISQADGQAVAKGSKLTNHFITKATKSSSAATPISCHKYLKCATADTLPHIGNDHSEVYVQAIGVDQNST